MNIKPQNILSIAPKCKIVEELSKCLNMYLDKYNIDTELRVAHFLAQTAHESAEFTRFIENLNYGTKGLLETFDKYFNKSNVINYNRNPEKIANKVYANRMGNGNPESGDGWKFRGRGLIQLTGQENYFKFFKSINKPINIDYLTTPEGAVESSCWYWDDKDTNHYADIDDIVSVTKKINGGTLGLDSRKLYLARAKKVIHDIFS